MKYSKYYILCIVCSWFFFPIQLSSLHAVSSKAVSFIFPGVIFARAERTGGETELLIFFFSVVVTLKHLYAFVIRNQKYVSGTGIMAT